MIVALFVVWLGGIIPQVQLHNYGQPSAVLYEDQLFVAIIGSLYRGPVEPSRREMRSPIRYVNEVYNGRKTSSQAKFEIRDDRFLLFQAGNHHAIFPIVDLQLLEANDYAAKLRSLRGFKHWHHFTEPFRSSQSWYILFPPHRKPDVPLPITPGSGGLLREHPETAYTLTARYDVQIAGPKSVRLFHAHEDTLFVSIEPDHLSQRYWDYEKQALHKNQLELPDRELRTGKLPAEFTERFAAYTSEKRDYLVTPNGKVYMSRPRAKEDVVVSVVWNDPKQRIVGVVQDLANDAVYGWGFVTDSAAPERFYVKMEPKPVAVAYKRMVTLWGDRSDAYLESYECARAFRKPAEKK